MTVAEVRSLLTSEGIGGAPVVDDSGKILGVVSRSDLVWWSERRPTVGESGRFFTSLNEYRDLANLPRELARATIDTVIEVLAGERPMDEDSDVPIAAEVLTPDDVQYLNEFVAEQYLSDTDLTEYAK